MAGKADNTQARINERWVAVDFTFDLNIMIKRRIVCMVPCAQRKWRSERHAC